MFLGDVSAVFVFDVNEKRHISHVANELSPHYTVKQKKDGVFSMYESQKRASAKWDKENMMIVGAKVRREFAAEFKAAGTSPNAVIKKAMADFIKSHRADGAE